MCDLSTRRGGGCLTRGAMALLLMLAAAGGVLGAPPDARMPAAPGSVASADAMLSVSDSPEFWWPCDSALLPFVPKAIYVIAQLDANLGGLTGAEFSVYGLDQQPNLMILSYAPQGVGALVFGDAPWAPADTSATSTGTGGITMAWPECRMGTAVPLLQILIMALGPVDPHPVEILRRFPPTHPTMPRPLVILCDGPWFTALSAASGCYWLNQPYACWLCVDATEPQTWGGVKGLFR